ncbi:MAG: hypothetical protein V4451_04715 [Pseudomonadota bacterium]
MDVMLAKAQAYVGTPYLPGEFDCADLAAKVQWELFGKVVPLPPNRKRPAGALGQAREVKALQGQLADPIDAPETGCAVLLQEPTDHGLMWHIGTVFMDRRQVWVLHNSMRLGGACLHRMEDLLRWGMRLESYYRCRTA